jgi:TonB family protein
MNGMWRGVSILAVAMISLMSVANAQSAPVSAPSGRKITSRSVANYPDLAKKMHVHGTVRVEALVRSNGSVKSTRILGGNPVLVDAAIEAVAKWKFEAGQSESTEVVQIVFSDN